MRVAYAAKMLHGMERRVGWFLLIGFVAALAVLIALSIRADVFARKIYLTIKPPTASGFYEGQPVRLQGFRVGWVDDLGLNEEGAWVRLAVLARYQPLIRADARVRLAKEGVIGEQFVEILGGKAEGLVQDRAELPFEPETTLEKFLESMKPVVEQAKQMLADAAGFMHWLNDPYGSAKQLVAHLEQGARGLREEEIARLTRRLADLTQRLDALVAEAHRAGLARNASEAARGIGQLAESAAPFVKEISDRRKGFADKIERLLQATADLETRLDRLAEAAEPEVPAIAAETRATLAEVRKLASDLRRSWLVGGGKEPRPEIVLTPGSAQ